MKVVVATSGKFHYFHLARQLEKRDMLVKIFTGYPRFKLKNEHMPPGKVDSYVASTVAGVVARRFFGPLSPIGKRVAWSGYEAFDRHVAAKMPACDAFIANSGAGLAAGCVAKRVGAAYVCDRGSAHIRAQNDLLTAEFERFGMTYPQIDERKMRKEEQEYALADLIFIPSTFAFNSFLDMGIPREKLRLTPYGVDLKRFDKVADVDRDAFDVLYVGALSLQKGIPDLLRAFELVRHKNKRLTLIGSQLPEVEPFLREARGKFPIDVVGIVAQPELKNYMSRSHVKVLASIQDGFGMVMAEAMACGCPVVATTHTGAPELYVDGVEGFIVEPRNPEQLADRLQRLADDCDLQARMSRAALERVKALGGWDTYGENIVQTIEQFKNG